MSRKLRSSTVEVIQIPDQDSEQEEQSNKKDLQGSSNASSDEYSDIDFDQNVGGIFGNLVPVNKNVLKKQEQMQAKMRRLMGGYKLNIPNTKAVVEVKQKSQVINTKNNKKGGNSQKQQIKEQIKKQVKAMKQQRSRSRDCEKTNAKIEKSKNSKDPKDSPTKILLIQLSDQQIESKQNSSVKSNLLTKNQNKINSKGTIDQEKVEKFAELQRQLHLPVDKLTASLPARTEQKQRQEKNEKRRVERLIERKYKQYKVGKNKDQSSNSVFNGIEGYFM